MVFHQLSDLGTQAWGLRMRLAVFLLTSPARSHTQRRPSSKMENKIMAPHRTFKLLLYLKKSPSVPYKKILSTLKIPPAIFRAALFSPTSPFSHPPAPWGWYRSWPLRWPPSPHSNPSQSFFFRYREKVSICTAALKQP